MENSAANERGRRGERGQRDGCLLEPIRVERLPRNFNVLKKARFQSLGKGGPYCLMTHRSRNTSIFVRELLSDVPPPSPHFSFPSLLRLSLSLFLFLCLALRSSFYARCFHNRSRGTRTTTIIRDTNRPTCSISSLETCTYNLHAFSFHSACSTYFTCIISQSLRAPFLQACDFFETRWNILQLFGNVARVRTCVIQKKSTCVRISVRQFSSSLGLP